VYIAIGSQYIVGIFLWEDVAFRGWVGKQCLLMISISEMGVFWSVLVDIILYLG
jgi:hypothetical protein